MVESYETKTIILMIDRQSKRILLCLSGRATDRWNGDLQIYMFWFGWFYGI